MDKKGYIYSVFVFWIFATVLVVAITNSKSIALMQDSNYDRITMMKVGNIARNIKNSGGYATVCSYSPPQGMGVQASAGQKSGNIGVIQSAFDDIGVEEIQVSCDTTAAYITITANNGFEYLLTLVRE